MTGPLLLLFILSCTLVSALSSSLLPPVAYPSVCGVTTPWSVTYPATASVLPVLQQATYNCYWYTMFVSDSTTNQTTSIAVINMLTGNRQWVTPFIDSLSIADPDPITPSTTITSRLYLKSFDLSNQCRRVQAVTWTGTGLTPVWRRTVCGVTDQGSVTAFLVFPFGGTSDVLLVIDQAGEEGDGLLWTSIIGSTGTVLHQDTSISPAYSVFMVGQPTDATFVVFQPASPGSSFTSALSYSISASGLWKQLANITFDGTRFTFPQSDPQVTGPLPPVLAIQDVAAADHWQGWDLRSGQMVWEVRNDSILTGAWAQSYPSFKASAYPIVARHPFNPNWLLISASASNASYAYIYQYALLDATSGQIAARSAVSAPRVQPGRQRRESVWYTSGDNIIIAEEGGDAYQYWRALDALNLSTVSTGSLNATVGPEVTHGYLQVTAQKASLWWTNANRLWTTVSYRLNDTHSGDVAIPSTTEAHAPAQVPVQTKLEGLMQRLRERNQ